MGRVAGKGESVVLKETWRIGVALMRVWIGRSSCEAGFVRKVFRKLPWWKIEYRMTESRLAARVRKGRDKPRSLYLFGVFSLPFG